MSPDNIDKTISPVQGDVVTISYKNLAQYMIPVEPKVIRVRADLDWALVISNHKTDATLQQLNGKFCIKLEYLNSFFRSFAGRSNGKFQGIWILCSLEKASNEEVFRENIEKTGFEPFGRGELVFYFLGLFERH